MTLLAVFGIQLRACCCPRIDVQRMHPYVKHSVLQHQTCSQSAEEKGQNLTRFYFHAVSNSHIE